MGSNRASTWPVTSNLRSTIFSIEMVPAGHGDCLLMQYGSSSKPFRVLIDGGPYYCYSALLDRMRKFPEGLQLLVATHVDADHVEGIVKLLQDSSLTLPIRDVRFNGWHQIEPISEILSPVTGEYLSALIVANSLPWNFAFAGKAVTTHPPAYSVIELEGGLSLTVLAPPQLALTRLGRIWARTLREQGLIPGSSRDAQKHMALSRRFGIHKILGGFDMSALAEEAENSDDSIVNGSSIALLAEFEGRRVLLAGDSHPTVLEQGVRGWLASRQLAKMRLTAFKISHHGSEKSITNSLLKLLDCRNYLISTNGSYFGHPDDRAIARVIRHGGPGVVLHFNYSHAENRFWNDNEVRKREGFQVVYPHNSEGLDVDLNACPE